MLLLLLLLFAVEGHCRRRASPPPPTRSGRRVRVVFRLPTARPTDRARIIRRSRSGHYTIITRPSAVRTYPALVQHDGSTRTPLIDGFRFSCVCFYFVVFCPSHSFGSVFFFFLKLYLCDKCGVFHWPSDTPSKQVGFTYLGTQNNIIVIVVTRVRRHRLGHEFRRQKSCCSSVYYSFRKRYSVGAYCDDCSHPVNAKNNNQNNENIAGSDTYRRYYTNDIVYTLFHFHSTLRAII